jgi:hypothetical protein
MDCPRFVPAPQIEPFLGFSPSFVPCPQALSPVPSFVPCPQVLSPVPSFVTCPQVLSPVPSFVPCPQFFSHIVGTKPETIHHENTAPYDNFARYDSSGIQDITISLTQWINIHTYMWNDFDGMMYSLNRRPQRYTHGLSSALARIPCVSLENLTLNSIELPDFLIIFNKRNNKHHE